MTRMRTYTHEGPELTNSVTVHITDDGYVRMKADNLHDVLTHLGYRPTGDN
jgi:hypothetical protein